MVGSLLPLVWSATPAYAIALAVWPLPGAGGQGRQCWSFDYQGGQYLDSKNGRRVGTASRDKKIHMNQKPLRPGK
jgi:hypothetical protein